MTEIRQAEFIGKIKKALNRPDSDTRSLKDIIQKEPGSDDIRLLEKIRSRNKKMRLALLDRIIETGKLLNMVVIAEKDTASIAPSIAKIAAGKNSEWGDKKSVIAWEDRKSVV